MSPLRFAPQDVIFITPIGHPLSTDPKSLKSWQGSDVLSSETETQYPPTGHSYTPLLQQSTHTMGTFFGWKGRRGWVVVPGGWMVGAGGWEQDRRMTVLLWVRVIFFFFGVEWEDTAEGQSQGLCVQRFECRLCYTVHGSPRVQRERVIYFVDIMNVGVCFRVEQNTDVFAYSSAQGPSGGLLFWSCGSRGINHPVM